MKTKGQGMSHRRTQDKYKGTVKRLSQLLVHMGPWTGWIETAADQFTEEKKREEFSPGP